MPRSARFGIGAIFSLERLVFLIEILLHDLAKLGYLWLNKGVWDGRQIVSRAWVEGVMGIVMVPDYAAVGSFTSRSRQPGA